MIKIKLYILDQGTFVSKVIIFYEINGCSRKTLVDLFGRDQVLTHVCRGCPHKY